MFDDDSDDLVLFSISSVLLLAEANLIASVVAQKRKVAPAEQRLIVNIGRKPYHRPVYIHPTW